MKINDLRIGTRLGAGFAMVLLLTAAVAWLGIHGMSKSNDEFEKIVNQNVYKMELLRRMSDSVHIVARITHSVVLLTEPAEIDNQIKLIASARERYNGAWEALQKTPTDAAGEALRAKLRAAQQVTRPLNNKVVELAKANSDAEATALLMREASPATSAWQQAIEEDIVLQQNNNKQAVDEAAASYASMRTWLLELAGLAIVIGAAVAWFVTRSITGPTSAAVKVAQAVAAGDLTSRIAIESNDETGMLMQALKVMNDSLIGIVGNVRSGTDMIATASGEIAAGNFDLSSRTEEQASSLEETAASMEELTTTVRNNADNARQANTLSIAASEVAVQGGAVVSQVVDTMGAINEASRKIVDIIAVIDGIAFQTNILALNAAVEAARAGEQGRGFAVVASEVRTLAQRSAAAAKEIKELIGASVEQVEAGTKLVDRAGATMDDVVTSIRRVTDIMGEITTASQEQSGGIEQVNQAIGQMDEVTQQNAALVEESAAAAASMQDQAAKLAQVVSIFKLDQSFAAAPVTAVKAAPAISKPGKPLAKLVRPAARVEPVIAKPAAPARPARAKIAPAAAAAVKREPRAAAASADDWEEF
ncbi:MAG TPA: methyl-accepting chemotaxis protein [Telluria sp.]